MEEVAGAMLVLIVACGGPEPARPVDSSPPGEEIPTERAALEPQTAPEVCFYEASTLLACDAAERPDDVPDALEQLHDQLEGAARRPVGDVDALAVPAPGDLALAAAALDPVARGLACHAEPQSAAWALYWMARVRHDALRFAQAATLFDEVVSRAPESEIAAFSVNLGLDSLVMRARQRPSLEVQCHARIADRVSSYRQVLCEGDGGPEDTCATLQRLRCQLDQREADDRARAGEMAAASTAYEGLSHDGCEDGDVALFNAAVTAEHAGDAERAQRMRDELARRFPTSTLVGR